jgi:hypothetical protein
MRLAMAGIAACLAAVALYALLRIAQFYVFPEPNPATVIWSAHAGYFWRSWTVAYAGGMAGFFGYAASARHAERVARLLVVGLTVASVLIAVQGLFVP